MNRPVKTIMILALLALVASGLAAWYLGRPDDSTQYRTAPVRRTDIVSNISATGTVVPEDVVDVGAQVNGQIASFGNDTDGKPVDYRSTVEEGMVLALIDDSLYAADVSTSKAQLAQAQAQVQVAQANKEQSKAKLDQASRDWDRAQKLGQSAALAQADYDAARSTFEQATAGLAVADSSIAQAQAQVSIAQAAVQRAQRNLGFCTIKSPVSGVIIDRRVDIGQTVVASLNAPSLFLIAKDLRRMQVLVQVNEADIGNVYPGQSVNFSVDAFGGQMFKGEVRKVRLNATMTQNVVTYTVEIVTDNSELKLLPYLTANVKFIVAQREQILAVPNAALRWSPRDAAATTTTTASAAPASRGSGGSTGNRRARPSSDGGSGGGDNAHPTSRPKTEASPTASTIWLLIDGHPHAVSVRAGLTDGAVTEIESTAPELTEGALVIVGEESAQARSTTPAAGASPFTPQMPGRRPGGGGGGGR